MSDSKDISASTALAIVTQAAPPGNATQATLMTASGDTMSIQVPVVVDSAKTFDKFDDLLPELKTKIFGFAAGQRVIIAIEVPNLYPIAPPGATLSDEEIEDAIVPAHFKFIGAKEPEIFKVCKQMKLDAMAMGYKPMFEQRFSGHFVWFNPAVDILHIHSESMRFGIHPSLTLFWAIGNPFHVFGMTAVSFPLTTFYREKKWLLENIKPMCSLERLELFEVRQTDRVHPEFELTIHFKEDFDQGIMVPHVEFAGGLSLADSQAMNEIDNWVNNAEATFLRNLWGQLSVCMNTLEHFPADVVVAINYVY